MLKQSPTSTVALEDNRRFQQLIGAVVDYAIFMIEPDGTIATWNPGAERIKGYAPSDIIGKNYEVFFTPEDRAAGKPRHALETARRIGRFETEGWRVRKDGKRFWALAVIDAIVEDGKLVGFAKVTRDMTEARAAHEALRQSEARFRLLVTNVVDYAIYMLDLDGRVAAWNAGAERIKGYTAAEIIGRHFSRFYTEQDRARGLPATALATALGEGKFEAEGWRLRKDGTRFWAHVIIDPVRDERGRHIGYAKITRDLTERRQAQLQLEETREALAHAQKMEAIGQLSGGVAHDFNNILAAIVNSLELGRRTALIQPDLRRQIEAALQAAYNGAALVQQLLVFARKQPIQAQVIDVKTTLENFMTLVRRSFPEQIDIRTEIAPDIGAATADPHLLQTALLNLVINARDAMPKGGTVTIGAARAASPPTAPPAPSGYICLSVADTGTGMPPEILQHAFEPFFTTKEIGRGTGLGLAMVYGALRQMQGDATIESAPDIGTTVRLWLPVQTSGATVAAEPPPEPPAAENARGAELIFVEDDPIVSLSAIELLESAGYRVHEASRADQALALIDRHKDVDILVTDVGLPGMNGQELVAEARRRRPHLRVLFITGYDRTGTLGHTALAPHTAHIGKPYQPTELFEALRKLRAEPAAPKVA